MIDKLESPVAVRNSICGHSVGLVGLSEAFWCPNAKHSVQCAGMCLEVAFRNESVYVLSDELAFEVEGTTSQVGIASYNALF